MVKKDFLERWIVRLLSKDDIETEIPFYNSEVVEAIFTLKAV